MDKKFRDWSQQDLIAHHHSSKEHHTYEYLTMWSSLMDIHHYVSPSARWYFLYLVRVVSAYTLLSAIVAPFVFAQLWNYADLTNQTLWFTLTHTYPFHWMSSAFLSHDLRVWLVVILIAYMVLSMSSALWHLYRVKREREKVESSIIAIHGSKIESRFDGRMGPGSSSFHTIDTLPQSLTQSEVKRYLVVEFKNGTPLLSPPAYSIRDMKTQIDRNVAQATTVPRAEAPRSVWRVIGCRLLSAVVCLCMLVMQAWLNYYINYVEYGTSWTLTLIPDAIASAAITLINMLFEYASYEATKIELHKSMTNFHRSFFIKSFAFQMVSLVILSGFGNSSLFTHRGTSSDSAPCTMIRLSSIYTTSIASMMVVSCCTALLVIRVRRWLSVHCCRMGSDEGDLQFAANFPITMELMDVLYKKFFTGLGLFVMPATALFMTGAIAFEGVMDKIKVRRCAPTVPTDNPFEVLLVVAELISLGVITYLWWTISAINNCPSLPS